MIDDREAKNFAVLLGNAVANLNKATADARERGLKVDLFVRDLFLQNIEEREPKDYSTVGFKVYKIIEGESK